MSATAFAEPDDKRRIEYLIKIKGVGIALASCVLAFYDPSRYAIFDIHIWRAVNNGTKEPKSLFRKVQNYVQLLKRLRQLSKVYDVSVRDLEIALFMKDRGS